MRGPEYPQVEQELFSWIQAAWSHDPPQPVNGEVIRKKAKQIAQTLNITGFQASNGWLCKFMERKYAHDESSSVLMETCNSSDVNSTEGTFLSLDSMQWINRKLL